MITVNNLCDFHDLYTSLSVTFVMYFNGQALFLLLLLFIIIIIIVIMMRWISTTTTTNNNNNNGLLQRWLYWREHLKYVRNVYCVATNHRWDLHTTETTGDDSFRSAMEQIIFLLFKDTNCLIRNVKHRCSPKSVPRTASSTSFEAPVRF